MAQRTYFLMPNFDCPPDTLIKLGQIFSDLNAPTEALAAPLEPLPTTIHSYKTDWESEKLRIRSGSVGIFTQVLASVLGVGVDAAVKWEREDGSKLKFDTLDTYFIEPTAAYVEASMVSGETKRFFENHPKNSAYMVTGIKVARGASVGELQRRKLELESSVGINTTAAGVPIEIGPKVSRATEITNKVEFSGSSDFVFAYRLRKIYKERKSGAAKSENHVKGALYEYGEGREEDTADEKAPGSSSEEFQVVGIGDDDVGAKEKLRMYESLEVVGKDGDGAMFKFVWAKKEDTI